MENIIFAVDVNGEEKKVTGEELNKYMKELLSGDEFYFEEFDGVFYGELYVDRTDELSSADIKDIVNSKDSKERLYEILNDASMEWSTYEEVDLRNKIERLWNTEKYGEFENYSDYIWDYIIDHVRYEYPVHHFMNQEVQVNLLVDTGDGNYDYTLNNFLSYNSHEEEYKEIEEDSSILWLVKNQGYTEQDLIEAIEQGSDSAFLSSVVEELENVTTHMNGLGFFVRMTLEDFIDFKDNGEYIKLEKDTSVGLVDFWNGGGSLMSIALEDTVKLDRSIVNVSVDGSVGYSVSDIYGLSSDFWGDTVEVMFADKV